MLAEEWSQSDVARHFGVSPQAINKIVAKARKEGADQQAGVKPVAHDDAVEIIPRSVIRPISAVQQSAPPTFPASEWRGIGLAPTLGDRFRQLEIVQSADAAREFAIREAWTLMRQGSSLESISQQFDLPFADVEGFISEARSRALARIDSFDPRLSLSAALSDIEMARSAAMRTLLSAKASDTSRSLARDALIRVSARETELAISISQYRKSQGLDDGDPNEPDAGRLDHWFPAPMTGGRTR